MIQSITEFLSLIPIFIPCDDCFGERMVKDATVSDCGLSDVASMTEDRDTTTRVGRDVAASDQTSELLSDQDTDASHLSDDAVGDCGARAAQHETIIDSSERALNEKRLGTILDRDCCCCCG